MDSTKNSFTENTPKREKIISHQIKKETCVLVGIYSTKIKSHQTKDKLEELALLAKTAGAIVKQTFIQRVQSFNPATLIGEGKVSEIKNALENLQANMVIFDEELSGSQIKNLETRLPGIKVLDRTGIILDIFAKHAKTAESRLMVEIAQLEYMMPRLTRAWTHLCRQHNGGIGTKGPGETQLETDRRLIRKRIQDLKKKLKKIEAAREMQAENRNDIFHVGIVGYTNAGKSTLTNCLTNANVYIENKLFATLDSTTRKLFLEGEHIILSDTVGFIRKLPHHLIETFKSTLGVAREADCILEVIDASAPDYKEHIEVTAQVLNSITDKNILHLYVFNKMETTSEEREEELHLNYPEGVFISAKENIGMEHLKDILVEERAKWNAKRKREKEEELNAIGSFKYE